MQTMVGTCLASLSVSSRPERGDAAVAAGAFLKNTTQEFSFSKAKEALQACFKMGNIKSGTDPETGIDDDIDDEAWKKLFLRLTGGHEEAPLLDNGKNTNLSPSRKESLPRTNSKHDSLGLLAPPAGSLSRLSLSRLSVTRLGGTPLPDLKDRTIDLDTLEKYIMGVKESYTLEIEYGIPRSQLCKAVKKMKLADKDNNGQIGRNVAIKV